MRFLVKIVFCFLTLCSTFIFSLTYNPQSESVQCFVVKQGGKDFFLSEGVVYRLSQTGKRVRLGRTSRGCLVTKKLNSGPTILQFHPDKRQSNTQSSSQYYEFQADLNQNNNFNLRANETRQCFLIEENGKRFFFSDGIVYQVSSSGVRKRLGRTDRGCLTVKRQSVETILEFVPDKKRSGESSYQFKGSLDEDNDFFISDLSSEICFLANVRGKKVYYFSFSKGQVFENGRMIAETDKSCFVIDKGLCKKQTTLQFQPQGLARFDQIMTFKNINTCKSIDLVINKKTFDYYSKFSNSIPYVENVDLENQYFRDLAKSLTKECAAGDKNCQIFVIYKYVTKNFRYIYDTIGIDGKDQIISPLDTIKRGGGDCEDLTALLNSILSGLNIENYVVLTSNHAYSLVCDLSVDKMKELVKNGLIKQDTKTKKVTLRPRSYQIITTTFFNELPKKSMIQLSSNSPIDFYFSKSSRDAENVFKNLPVETVSGCEQKSTMGFKINCNTKERSVNFLIYNPLRRAAQVNFKADTSYYAFRGSEPKLSAFRHKGKECLLLEATLDDDGYPGFSNQKGRSNLAINPKNWDWFIF